MKQRTKKIATFVLRWGIAVGGVWWVVAHLSLREIIDRASRVDPALLVLAVAVFPLTFIITSYRWYKLLQAVDVRMTLSRTFVINMVGAFYNTFMLGSVGGDVFKAYYASKQTVHRARAVVSVFVDRLLGMLALVMVGGVMATFQYLRDPDLSNPTSRKSLQVALICAGIMAAVGVALALLLRPELRHRLGLEWILNRLPMQRHIGSAREVARIYRSRPGLILWALLVTIPVHVTVIFSAMLAGKAFGLPIQPLFYFTAVPIIVLVGSIPVSPLGLGPMDLSTNILLQHQANVAFLLTNSIRVVQILWNLTGGIFVLRGGFHVPTESEQRELESDDDDSGELDARRSDQAPATFQPQMNADDAA